MKYCLKKSFNDGDENYFKLEIADENDKDFKISLLEFFDDLGFKKLHIPFPGLGPKYEEDFSKQPFKRHDGQHLFFENEHYTIHMIFSGKNLHLVIKCNEGDRKSMWILVKKYFEILHFA